MSLMQYVPKTATTFCALTPKTCVYFVWKKMGDIIDAAALPLRAFNSYFLHA